MSSLYSRFDLEDLKNKTDIFLNLIIIVIIIIIIIIINEILLNTAEID